MVYISLRMKNRFRRICSRFQGACAPYGSAQTRGVASNARVIVGKALSNLPAKRLTARELCASGKRISEAIKARLKTTELTKEDRAALARSFSFERHCKTESGRVMARQNLARGSIDREAGPVLACPVF